MKGVSVYQKALPLSPGLYRLDIVLKDINSNNVGVVNARLAVPPYDDDKLDASTLILADMIHRWRRTRSASDMFVIGSN